MKVLIAPDKFKGTLTAVAAAEAIAAGWRHHRPDDELVLAPLADGGTGTLEVAAAALPGAERVVEEVADALGRPTQAPWLRLPDGRALVEAAQAIGLDTLAPDERDPLHATSYGVGQLVAAADRDGATGIIVGLGGSATVDGGAGLATALGHRLCRGDGNGVKVGARFASDLERIEPAPPLRAPLVVAADVTNPLLGPDGAVAVYAPQKGAGPDDLPLLEAALRRLADVAERDLSGGPWRHLAGAGAAGGLGFALLAFCEAEIRPGAAVVADLIGFADDLDGADVVITGEGKLDAQTAWGKAPDFVAHRARDRGARLVAIAGAIEAGAAAGYDVALELGPGGFDRPAELVTARAAELAATFEEPR